MWSQARNWQIWSTTYLRWKLLPCFDADLHTVYQAGFWNASIPRRWRRTSTTSRPPTTTRETGLGRRVVRLGTVPVGSLVVRGETTPLVNNAIASLIAITFDRYRAFANESRIETERRTEQLRAMVLDNLAHAYKTPLTAIRAASTGLGEMGHLIPRAGRPGGVDR
jgi:two-component system sensor histidine kinase KdpD